MSVTRVPDPTATIAALDDRLRAALLDLSEGVASRWRREQAALVALVERRRRDGEPVTVEWLVERYEYRVFVDAFTDAWTEFAAHASWLIAHAGQAATRRARVDALALLGEPATLSGQAPSGTAVGRRADEAAIAAIGGDVARALVRELVRG